MTLTPDKFRKLATKLVTSTFGGFQKALVMRTANAVVHGQSQTYASETGTGIDIEVDLTLFESQSIEVNDIMIVTNVEQWSTDPKLSNVDITFEGKSMSIEGVKKDAAKAAYFILARAK